MIVNKAACIFLTVVLLLFSPVGYATESDIALTTAENLTKHKFSKVYKSFDKKVKKQISKPALEKLWIDKEKGLGEYKSIGKITTTTVQGFRKSTIQIKYENGQFELTLYLTKKNKIAGLSFSIPEYSPPPEAVNKVFGREKIIVQTDTFKMKGELLLPEDCNQCPVVIILQGSGPSNMDGSNPTNPNRPYLDLAYGFALSGIASIRFDKRTYTYGKNAMPEGKVSLESEYIEDALSAIKLAKSYPFLDSTKIAIVGHSLGAYSAPLIAARDTSLSGIVVLSGPVRPVFEVIPDQYEFLLQLDNKYTDDEKALVDSMRQEVLLIQKKPSTVKELKHLGTNAMLPYYDYMINYNPIDTIKKLDCKVLIAQGNRDYQVRYDQEYNRYFNSLNTYDHVSFKLFEGLNHLLMFGTKPSTPSEYYVPGNVDEQVTKYIAEWMLNK